MAAQGFSEFDYEFWPEDAEEGDSYVDTVLGRPKSSGSINTIRLSRKIIAEDVVAKLGGTKPAYRVIHGYGSWRCYVNTTIPANSGKNFQLSGDAYGDRAEAEERAAATLLSSLQRNLNFQVDDVNWRTKCEYHCNRFDLYTELKACRRRVDNLVKMNKLLEEGWGRTLDSVGEMVKQAGDARAAATDVAVVCKDKGEATKAAASTISLEDYCDSVLSHDSDRFNQVTEMNNAV